MKVKYCDRITIKGLMRISGRRKKQAVECLKGDRSGKDGGLGVNVSFITRVTEVMLSVPAAKEKRSSISHERRDDKKENIFPMDPPLFRVGDTALLPIQKR
eukprot:scaffold159522_cov36-Cyclotella_meneghiniana.AAC.1